MRDERFPGTDSQGERSAPACAPVTNAGPNRLQALLDALPVGVFTVDGGGSILCLNDAAARVAGRDVASSIGQPCAEVFRCTVCGPVCLARQARMLGRFDRTLPTDVHGADGSVRSFAASARALSGGDVAITLSDVTAAERLRRDLEARGADTCPVAAPSGPVARDAARETDTRAALHRAAGNVTIAARLLGIHRTTLWRRMCAQGLDRERFHPGTPPS